MLYARIKKKLGNFTLDITLESKNEILALLGASGCGKSMTLKCIAGIETPDEGEIILNDRVLFHSKNKINLPPQLRKTGLLFQNYALFPNMTLEENISIGLPKNFPNKKEVIENKIKAFSLEGLENNYPHQLSGGQQQRVALARMLVNQPEILMLDEPFSALDEHLRWQMEQELISILKSNHGSTLYVSHNKDEVYRICNKVAVFNNGKIDSIKEKTSLFDNPETLNAAILTGCKNISKVKRISNNKIYAIDWNLELVCNEIANDNIQYVGIHTTAIEYSSDLQGENIVTLNIVDTLQNLDRDTVVLSNKDSSSFIYMDLPKGEYAFNAAKSISIKFDKKNLLLLY